MAVPATRPCELWTTSDSCIELCSSMRDASAAIVTRAIVIATELVWALSGRRFGICTRTVRPCRRSCAGGDYPPGNYAWWGSWPWVISWPNAFLLDPWCRACGRRGQCGCARLEQLALPRRPVTEVSEVIVNGEVLDPDDYRVDDYRWLVRLDGGTWPTCQDLTDTDATGPDNFSVSFSWGHPQPASGTFAVERLACELVKLMNDDEDCALPPRIQSLTRNGLSMNMLDPNAMLDKHRTGIWEVDTFLEAFNPKGLQQRARVYRADAMPATRRLNT